MVAFFSMMGLACILFVTIYQYSFHTGHTIDSNGICTSCTHQSSGSLLNVTTIFNSLGGLLLASAHFLNYKLCRKADCSHS